MLVMGVHNKMPKGRVYVTGSNNHYQLGHRGKDSLSLKVVLGLTKRTVTAIYSSGNQNQVIDSNGRLICFGEGWNNANPRESKVFRTGDFQDVALAESVTYALVKETNGNFTLKKVGKDEPVAVEFEGEIIQIGKMKTVGNHVGVQVVIKS